jgi:hypothetical protein
MAKWFVVDPSSDVRLAFLDTQKMALTLANAHHDLPSRLVLFLRNLLVLFLRESPVKSGMLATQLVKYIISLVYCPVLQVTLKFQEVSFM